MIKKDEEKTADMLSADNESARWGKMRCETLLVHFTIGISFNPASKAYFNKCSLDEYSCFSS